jgi:hypothetical protein
MPYSSLSGCTEAARAVFEAQGFARITKTGSTVMAAYRPDTDYEFKAAIKCLPAVNIAVAFVVTPISGRGLDMANGLASAMQDETISAAGPDRTMMGEEADGFIEEDDAVDEFEGDGDIYDDDFDDYEADTFPPAP